MSEAIVLGLLSNYTLELIRDGLEIPNPKAIEKMSSELLRRTKGTDFKLPGDPRHLANALMAARKTPRPKERASI